MIAWLKGRAPSRDDILRNRFLRPFAHHLASPNLWHFNRYSVPRGVAVGLFCAVMVPVAHTPVAALAASPFRANVVVAAASTWLVNPITIGPLLIAAHWIGLHVAGTPAIVVHHSWLQDAAAWAGDTMVGLLPIAIVAAAAGYALARTVWRIRTGRKWARRNRA